MQDYENRFAIFINRYKRLNLAEITDRTLEIKNNQIAEFEESLKDIIRSDRMRGDLSEKSRILSALIAANSPEKEFFQDKLNEIEEERAK